jgi:cytochrome c556
VAREVLKRSAMRRTSWIVLALVAGSCESGPLPARPPAAPAKMSGTAARHHMAAHLEAATALQTAVAHGRLVDARAHASWFGTHAMGDEWGEGVSELRDAAAQIEHARDVPAAAAQVGRLGRACGACHEANHAAPAFGRVVAPTDVETIEAQMARHQWAAARLWEGLVGPADKLWIEGAQVMATARLDVAKLAHEKPNVEVIELAERLHDQATHASELTAQDARAAAYGAMLTTCAGCHVIVRPRPVADGASHD